jgi:hypothetical protein
MNQESGTALTDVKRNPKTKLWLLDIALGLGIVTGIVAMLFRL